MRSIRLRIDQDRYHITSKVFSGGEIHVDINHLPALCHDYSVKARLQNSEDIMHFFMLSDALYNRYPDAKASFTIPYLPYARQDRMCAPGQHFGLQRFCEMLLAIPQRKTNNISLVVYDLHSDVAVDMLHRTFNTVRNVQQSEIITHCHVLDEKLKNKKIILCSPDKGATMKTREIAAVYGATVIVGGKKRDPHTGALTGFEVDADDLFGNEILIVDDIADGGGTFLGLAAELKRKNAGKISLMVTHGIFSKGFEAFSGLIDDIYATDSFDNGYSDGEVAPGVFYHTVKI